MVDSLTSYYQERMNVLSAGQQKIVEALCSQRAPMTVKQIARSCFISPSSASSELKRLTDLRYVTSHPAGRESYYEIREPLFRICFEVKENRGYPVRLFVDFLGTFYTAEALERKYRSAHFLSLLYQARGRSNEERRERERLLYLARAAVLHHGIELASRAGAGADQAFDVAAVVRDLIEQSDHHELARLADAMLSLEFVNAIILRLSAWAHRELGDLEVARRRVEDLIRVAPHDAAAWAERAEFEVVTNDRSAAEASYRRGLEIDPVQPNALHGPVGILVGKLQAKTGLDGKSSSAVTSPIASTEDSEYLREICALSERACARAPSAWAVLGAAQSRMGNWEEGLASLRQACMHAPTQVAGWQLRVMAALQLGHEDEARESLMHITLLQPDDAAVWRVLASVQERIGDIDAALNSVRHATQNAPESGEYWLYRARLAVTRGFLGEALESFEKAAEQPAFRAVVYSNAAVTYFQHGRYAEGLTLLESILARGLEFDEDAMAALVTSASGMLLVKSPREMFLRFLAGHHAAFESAGRARAFVLGVSQALKYVMQLRDEVGLKRLQELAAGFVPELARHEELSVMARLFTTGVRYLSAKDERILLELPLEERQVLLEMIEPATEPSKSR